jgi:hypothetical protein
MDHIGAGGLALAGRAQHVHGDERRDQPAPRRTQAHLRLCLDSIIPAPLRRSGRADTLREKVAIPQPLWLSRSTTHARGNQRR